MNTKVSRRMAKLRWGNLFPSKAPICEMKTKAYSVERRIELFVFICPWKFLFFNAQSSWTETSFQSKQNANPRQTIRIPIVVQIKSLLINVMTKLRYFRIIFTMPTVICSCNWVGACLPSSVAIAKDGNWISFKSYAEREALISM